MTPGHSRCGAASTSCAASLSRFATRCNAAGRSTEIQRNLKMYFDEFFSKYDSHLPHGDMRMSRNDMIGEPECGGSSEAANTKKGPAFPRPCIRFIKSSRRLSARRSGGPS
jgi:hypothetical protein